MPCGTPPTQASHEALQLEGMTRVVDLSQLHRVEIGCLVDGRPFPEAWVSVKIGMLVKNSFGHLWGPANTQGVLTITGDELLESAVRIRNLFLPDYVHPGPETLSGELSIEPLTIQDLDRALAAYELFGPAFYPAGYEKAVRAFRKRAAALPAKSEVAVEVLSAEPPDEFTITTGAGRRRLQPDT
jgi:hypothetical protein